MTLEARSLGCQRGDRRLFSKLNFRLNPGEVLELRGSNGSGKTSLLRILGGLSEPAEGEVRWQNHPIAERRIEYLSGLSYVGHAHALKADLTAAENLGFHQALRSHLGVQEATSAVSIKEALQAVGFTYKQMSRLPCRQLSAGQQKRVALARLLLANARLWLLDEPLTALDDGSVVRVEGLIADHVRAKGMLVVATHRPLNHVGYRATELRLDGVVST